MHHDCEADSYYLGIHVANLPLAFDALELVEDSPDTCRPAARNVFRPGKKMCDGAIECNAEVG